MYTHTVEGFPGSSAGKESACNAGDPRSIPGLGRSPGEGIGCPLQDSWASLVAQRIIHLQCGRPGFDPWVGKIPWRRSWQPSLYSCLENPYGQSCLVGYHPWGHKGLDTTEQLSACTGTHTHTHTHTHSNTI